VRHRKQHLIGLTAQNTISYRTKSLDVAVQSFNVFILISSAALSTELRRKGFMRQTERLFRSLTAYTFIIKCK